MEVRTHKIRTDAPIGSDLKSFFNTVTGMLPGNLYGTPSMECDYGEKDIATNKITVYVKVNVEE